MFVCGDPYFRPKNVTREAKHRAHKLKLQYLTQLAQNAEHPLDHAGAQALTEDTELREAVAMATYGHHLIRRIHGHSEGAALLVLWREFAWEESGSPKKAFRLNAEDILTPVNM